MSRGLGKTQRAIIALLDDVSAHRTIHELAGSIHGTAETSVAQRQNVRAAPDGFAQVMILAGPSRPA